MQRIWILDYCIRCSLPVFSIETYSDITTAEESILHKINAIVVDIILLFFMVAYEPTKPFVFTATDPTSVYTYDYILISSILW
jgi:hypothetical protein